MNTKNLAEVFSEDDLTLIQHLEERKHRLYCAAKAICIGKHGVAAVRAFVQNYFFTITKSVLLPKNFIFDIT